MRRLACLGLALSFATGAASARPNDLNLAGLVLRNPDCAAAVDSPLCISSRTGLFKQLVTELGIATAPQFTSPTQTLGALGFEIGFSTSVTNVHEDQGYWQYARRTDETVDGA